MRVGLLSLAVLSIVALPKAVQAASLCPSDVSSPVKHMFISMPEGTNENTDCTQQNTQIKEANDANVAAESYDTITMLDAPNEGAAQKTIPNETNGCDKRDDGSTDNDDMVGGSQVYNNKLVVLLRNNNDARPRIPRAVWFKGSISKVGSKFKNVRFLTNGTPTKKKACSMSENGVQQWYCPICATHVGNGARDNE